MISGEIQNTRKAGGKVNIKTVPTTLFNQFKSLQKTKQGIKWKNPNKKTFYIGTNIQDPLEQQDS